MAYVMLIGIALNAGENHRVRFQTEPFLADLLAL